MKNFDYVVLGAGIVGLAIARELKKRQPGATLLVLEKESAVGFHASGRNSGVLHSGLYYPPNSVKARVCVAGARAMAAYCDENGLPIKRIGKVILPTRASDDPQIDMLLQRGQANGANVRIIDAATLRKIEPEAHTPSGRALHSPDTAVVDSKTILQHLIAALEKKGVEFCFNAPCLSADPEMSQIKSPEETVVYGHLFNTTGQHADRIAKLFGASRQYVLLPFKGRYFRLRPDSGLQINGLIYPVPDLNLPFLGVHSVKNVHGEVFFGPSATPALGRENYSGLSGVELPDATAIFFHLFDQYRRNKQNFRRLMHDETGRLLKSNFVAAARALVPNIRAEHLVSCDKVGIRAQLLDLDKHELVMDFVVENKGNTTHVLNAISPAFTSSFRFAELVVDQHKAAPVAGATA